MLHYSYFSFISRFPHKMVHPFQNCGVRGGVGPVWIGKRPRNAKCPKTFVHDCSCVNYRPRTRVCLLHPVKSTQVTFHRATHVTLALSDRWLRQVQVPKASEKKNSIEISLKSSALWAVMMRLQKHRRERHIVGRSVIGHLGKFRLFLSDLWSFKL